MTGGTLDDENKGSPSFGRGRSHIDIDPGADSQISDQTTAAAVYQAVFRFGGNRAHLLLEEHRAPGRFAEIEKRAGACPNRGVKGYGYQRDGVCHVPSSRPLRLTTIRIYATSVHTRMIKISN